MYHENIARLIYFEIDVLADPLRAVLLFVPVMYSNDTNGKMPSNFKAELFLSSLHPSPLLLLVLLPFPSQL
jgi:hypothetical protein